MRYALLLFIFAAVALLPGFALAQQATPTPQEEPTATPQEEGGPTPPAAIARQVTKTACASAFAYDRLGELQAVVLAEAKRQAISELSGELITAFTQVENFVVTQDQIRSLSSGFVREGAVSYANGSGLGDVCVTLQAYTTVEDRARFDPVLLVSRSPLCRQRPELSVNEVRQLAREEALLEMLIDYDRKLADVERSALLRLFRQVSYAQDGFLTNTDVYCVQAQGYILPVEVMALLAIPTPTPTVSPTPTRTPTPTFTPSRTPTPTPPPAGSSRINPVDSAAYVYVPEGEFIRGSNTGSNDEQPMKTISVSAFWMKQTEVTNSEYAGCVKVGVCTAPGNPSWQSRDAKHPVTDVNWEQATAYAKWVGGRLPTEAEWEKACRGSDGRAYPWGNQGPNAVLLNFNSSSINTTTAVGSYPSGASPYNVLDMAGNVWEWTADWYGFSSYSSLVSSDPTGLSSGISRVGRGGAFMNLASNMHCASRNRFTPDARYSYVGFRVVLPSDN